MLYFYYVLTLYIDFFIIYYYIKLKFIKNKTIIEIIYLFKYIILYFLQIFIYFFIKSFI